jgi:hypothetical protein
VTDARLELRIGDRERRAVDAQLQAAVGEGVLTLSEYDDRATRLWEARTTGDLTALVTDLPGSRQAHAAPAPGPAGDVPPRRSVAVISEDAVAGPFLAGQAVETYVVMGSAKVDLRRDDLPAEVRVRAVSVMGEVSVLVPHGATVHLSGAALMAERSCRVDPPVAGGPVVHVDAWALMGTIKVKHGRNAPPPVPAQQSWSPPASAPFRAPPRRTGRGRRVVAKAAVLGALLVGAGAVFAAGDDAAAVFGSRTVVVPSGQSEVTVLFGSVTVVVPDDALVRQTGTVVFGSVDCDQACDPAQRGPRVDVRSGGGFGSVEVLTRSEAVAAEEASTRDDDRDDDDRDDDD